MRCISTCKAITITRIAITITIIHYFRKKKPYYGKSFGVAFKGVIKGIKSTMQKASERRTRDDERRRNQMVAKASIYFF